LDLEKQTYLKLKYVQGKFKWFEEEGILDDDLLLDFKDWLPFNNTVYNVKMFSEKSLYYGTFSLGHREVFFG